MENKDLKIKNEFEIKTKMKDAIESNDSEVFVETQIALAKEIEERILQEAKDARNEDSNDQVVMAKRGLNPLTSEEQKYYNEVITTEGFGGSEQLMPATIFDRVFEDLRLNHPLLSEIDFKNTTGVTEWITRSGDAEAAWWGNLTDAIQKKLASAFAKEKTELYKLSAYVPVAKAMLDLGPQWLDRFVRELLFESLAIALELAIVAGTGKNQPIGMIKDLGGSVVEGVYPDKAATALTSFDPVILGTKIMAPLTRNGKRSVPKVLLIVNPLDYWAKIFPATTVLTAGGTYVYGVLPIPGKIVQSVAVTQGTLVAGMAKDYFMGVGSKQKIEHSDHYKFLEDERTYIAKQYANGKPIDNDSFFTFDITNFNPKIAQNVNVINNFEARLAGLTIGSLTLDPVFNKSIHYYTTSTTNATNVITAVALDTDASIEIDVDGSNVNNGAAATWNTGDNTVTITVTNGTETETYTVVVTKS